MKLPILAALALFANALGVVPIPAFASNDPVADTRQIMAGTVTTKSIKNAYLSGARDNTAAFQGALAAYKAVRAAEQPVPPPPQWISAPLANGGYARIVKSEPSPWTPIGYAPAVGSVWYVVPKAWGYTANADGSSGREVHALEPVDQIGQAFSGFYTYVSDLEGVAPAPTMTAKAAAPSVSTAVATKTCMTRLGGASQAEARSGVVKGRSYRISRKWAGNAAGMVGADSGSPADGIAIVPESCFAQ